MGNDENRKMENEIRIFKENNHKLIKKIQDEKQELEYKNRKLNETKRILEENNFKLEKRLQNSKQKLEKNRILEDKKRKIEENYRGKKINAVEQYYMSDLHILFEK